MSKLNIFFGSSFSHLYHKSKFDGRLVSLRFEFSKIIFWETNFQIKLNSNKFFPDKEISEMIIFEKKMALLFERAIFSSTH